MSQRDDEAPKPESQRRGSIPAPANVPRPSRPAPPAQTAAAPATSQPLSNPPPSGRKGTLDGIHPSQRGAYSYAEPVDEEFDAEKTMVVDPNDDDAPTQDYDPRTMQHAYDPRARGVFSSSGSSSRPAATAQSPVIPAAPATPSFEGAMHAVPTPRASESGRRRTSRRTVKIPEDQVMRRPTEAVPEHLKPVDHGKAASKPESLSSTLPSATEAAPPTEPETSNARPAIADAATDAATPADGNAAMASEDTDSMADEITVVRPLRIINIGSDPPPPIRSALATWPPSAILPPTSDADTGWTPMAPVVDESGPSAQALTELENDVLVAEEAVVSEAPAITIRAESSPEMSERISEIPLSERDEILEDIEPDAAPFAAPAASQPKRPPPPPPKTKPAEAKSSTGDTQPRKGKPWWEDLFSDEYIRTHDLLDDKVIRREVDFIEESLGMEKQAVVLDLACGMGEHAIELAGRGYSVVGFDNSTGMLSLAEKKLKQRLSAAPNAQVPSFVQGDMRDLAYEEAFDGVYCWATSFGYFDEEKNLAVLQNIHRALRQGGMFLLEVINRDYVAPRSPSLVWFEGRQCVCMDDMYVDFFTSRLRVKRTAMFEGGLSRELDYSIRLYTLHELGKLLHDVGFKVVEVTGHPAHQGVFFGTESPRLIVLSERS